MNNETSSIIDQNEREYEGLIVSLEANQERLNREQVSFVRT